MPDGATQLTVTCFVPPMPVTDVGADGAEPLSAAPVVTELLEGEATLGPAAFVATTLKV